jgi:GNAT superfamily N-acetyltransferase
MTDDHSEVGRANAVALAAMHRQSFAASVLGRMGSSTLERYYRWVGRSTIEQLFLEYEADMLVGAAVLSLDPPTLIRRFVRDAPVTFVIEAVRTFARDAAFRREVRGFLVDSGDVVSALPEVMQIFVAPDRRGRNTGTRLLRRVEEWLHAHQLPRYYVRTLAENNVATLGFYRSRGFEPTGESLFCGTRYIVLEKAVAGHS